MDDIDKKLVDNESALIQGLITFDEYAVNYKKNNERGKEEIRRGNS